MIAYREFRGRVFEVWRVSLRHPVMRGHRGATFAYPSDLFAWVQRERPDAVYVAHMGKIVHLGFGRGDDFRREAFAHCKLTEPQYDIFNSALRPWTPLPPEAVNWKREGF